MAINIGIFSNYINDIPLNAKLYCVIDQNTFPIVACNYNSYSNLLNIVISPAHSNSNHRNELYLYNINETIRNNNLGNNVNITFSYGVSRYNLDLVDVSMLQTDGIVRFHMVRVN